jgi:hypothetical protein
MSAAKHTPGPWRLAEGRENSDGINDFIWSDADSREEREDARQWCIATVHAREERSTRVANAKLIAAAPDMAEALREIMRLTADADTSAAVYMLAQGALDKAGL